jgi:hypothetical protein
MDAVRPRPALIAWIEPHTPGEQERRSTFLSAGVDAAHPLATQSRYFSVSALQEALIDVLTMRWFVAIELISARIPNEVDLALVFLSA